MTGRATGRPASDTQASVAGQDPAGEASPALIVWLLVASAFVMILNETIMSVALPALILNLAVSVGTAQWLTRGFMLTMAVVIPVTGFQPRSARPRRCGW
jgi:DHA2 family lincomycin resistance protein-like MFS transporter